MTHKHFVGMRRFAAISCVCFFASLLTACAPAGGYYDANGKFISTDTRYSYPDNSRDYSLREDSVNHSEYTRYDRRGYYDHNGYYIPLDGGLSIPQNMFPPRGMCRVWFTGRQDINQPGIESCDGIRSRVPNGAYVIYGG